MRKLHVPMSHCVHTTVLQLTFISSTFEETEETWVLKREKDDLL